MKRTQPPRRNKPLHSLSAADRLLGTAASIAARRARSGIPADAPKSKTGASCVEKLCEICGKAYLAQWGTASKRKTCSRACAAIFKRRNAQVRTGTLNPNYRHGKRVGERNRAGEERWRAVIKPYCENPACLAGVGLAYRAQHHICYAQHVRNLGGDVWDPRNSLTLCASCHTRHHRRGAPIALTALPDSAYEFITELMGAEAGYEYLKRRYSGFDRRLDRMIAS